MRGKTVRVWLAILILLVAFMPAGQVAAKKGGPKGRPGSGEVDFWLTVFHNNDGESQLINAGSGLEDFGGVARFAARLEIERLRALTGVGYPYHPGESHGILTLSSGDNFLAGPEFNTSLEKGPPYYDSIALSLLRYDALAIGNHDFDFGPDVLVNFIGGVRRPTKFLSANLDFSDEPGLQELVDQGRIARSIIVRERGERIGIVGATTEFLEFISSPRDVIINPVLPAIQAEIASLQDQGVDKIILISHLQSIQEDLALIPQLSGVDIAIAGGGDELLANPGDLLIPGDEAVIFGEYPLFATDADGNEVPVVTTSGNYKYLGRLVVGFNDDGEVVVIDEENSGPIRIAGGDQIDAVPPHPAVQRRVVEPVQAALNELANTVIGTSEVDLDGTRTNVRSVETNEGNLIADALRWQAEQLADEFGVPVPQVGLQNGGGIRNDSIISAGPISLLNTFDMVPFANFVVVVPDVPREQFKEILENAVSRVELGDGRFAQISGFSFTWDPAGTPQELDATGNVVTPGTRVVDVTLDDGTVIVSGGAVVPGDPLDVATIDFLATGGDQYPFRGAAFTRLGATYQQAVANYIRDGLGGLISAADYPEGGEGRVTRLP